MRICLFFIISTISTLCSVDAQGVSMSPTRLFFTGNPGDTVTETVILSNSSDQDYTLSISYKDWRRDEDGNKLYFEPGSLKRSNASWISTTESTLNIPPESSTEVLVTMQIPEELPNTTVTNSMMFFTQIPRQSDEASVQSGIGIITLFEFGLHLYYTPAENTTKSLEITNMEEVHDKEFQNQNVVISIRNDGNVVNDATVEFELTNTDTGSEIKMEPNPISMMPEAEQVVRFPLPEDLSGNYLGVAIIKMAGSNDIRVGEKTFTF